MRKIISGKMYNTNTAKQMGYYENDFGVTDFRWQAETLYKKKTGEYFIFGEGNAMSDYAESIGDMMGSGSAIRPITEKEAKRWVETHLDADNYITIFGEPEEQKKEGKINNHLVRYREIAIPDDEVRLEQAAAYLGLKDFDEYMILGNIDKRSIKNEILGEVRMYDLIALTPEGIVTRRDESASSGAWMMIPMSAVKRIRLDKDIVRISDGSGQSDIVFAIPDRETAQDFMRLFIQWQRESQH